MHILKQAALLCCGLLALAAASIVSAGDDSSPDASLRAGTAEWIAAYNAGNVDRIVALYAEDALVMPPEAPAASGHAAIREFLTKDIASSKAAGITLSDLSSGSTTGHRATSAGIPAPSRCSMRTAKRSLPASIPRSGDGMPASG